MSTDTRAITRAAIAVAQGIALYLLFEAAATKAWPATDALVFAPLQLIALFVPLVVVVGIGTLPPRVLATFALATTVLLALLGAYDAYRVGGSADQVYSSVIRPGTGASAALIVSIALGLFISFSLAAAGRSDGPAGKYARHFDVAWKLGVQLALSLLFTGVFWLLLWLGAELFRLIKLEFLSQLIKQRWFAIPVTTIAFVLALHLTDVQAALVRGTRTLLLTLLAWLLPLMTVITVGFLAALLFTGLDPLWSTKNATSLLLTAAIVLIFLINAAYQDGQAADATPVIVRELRRVAAVALLPLVLLAAYALMLRVGQYGWTPQRIIAVPFIAVTAAYAAGYTLAVIRHGATLEGLEQTNFVAAYAILASLLLLLTPIADPTRLAVADQLRRLELGKVTPDAFDFRFLRFRAGRYGIEALNRLASQREGPNAVAVAAKAEDILKSKSPYKLPAPTPATAQSRTANIKVVHPAGQALPDSFVQQDWAAEPRLPVLPPCLTAKGECVALLTSLDGDETPEILLVAVPYGVTAVFKSSAAGRWSSIGTLANSHCQGVREALKAGAITTLQAPMKDIEASGHRLSVVAPCAPGPAK